MALESGPGNMMLKSTATAFMVQNRPGCMEMAARFAAASFDSLLRRSTGLAQVTIGVRLRPRHRLNTNSLCDVSKVHRTCYTTVGDRGFKLLRRHGGARLLLRRQAQNILGAQRHRLIGTTSLSLSLWPGALQSMPLVGGESRDIGAKGILLYDLR